MEGNEIILHSEVLPTSKEIKELKIILEKHKNRTLFAMCVAYDLGKRRGGKKSSAGL